MTFRTIATGTCLPRLVLFLAAALAILTVAPRPVLAANPLLSKVEGSTGGQQPGSLDSFLEEARKAGSTVIVVKPEQPKAVEKPEPAGMSISNTTLLQARANISKMFHNTELFVIGLPAILKSAGSDGSLFWVAQALVTAIGGLMLGTLLFRATARWGRDHFGYVYNPNERRRSGKLQYLLGRAGWMLLSTAIMFATAMLVEVIFDTGEEASRKTIFVIVSTYAGYKILRHVMLYNFLAPDVPAHRLVNLSNEAAQRLYRDWSVVLGVSAFIIGICRWIQELELNNDAQRLGFIVAMLVSAVMFGALAIRHRNELYEMRLGPGDPRQKPAWKRLLALSVLPLILIYLAAAWFVSSIRLSLGLPGGYLLVGAPIIVFIVAIFAYGLAIYLLELIYEARATAYRREQILKSLAENRAWRRAQAAKEIAANRSEDERDLLEDGEEMSVHTPVEKPKDRPREFRPAFKDFFENAILAVILVVSARGLARLWGVDMNGEFGQALSSTLDILLILFLAASSYRAINNYIDTKIIEEGGSLDDHPVNPGEGEGEAGRGQSRLATLLPVFRNVIICAIVVLAFIFVLSYLGVNVGPLFAGAGLVGIAIGFGAQTLIRDIFSGAFFLIDDAFRKGEYVEIGQVKGVVEKISMRSFQLRHHLGALHTVPFGEIKQLTNYSRDWVMMKLPLRLTYDTDVEKVRKLIKKLGQQLLEDPVIGPLFMQPLKSQGVYAMEDSAMIIRVKYMTRPGDQFVTRKVIYAAIRELFQKEGIHFAHREVTVRLADGMQAENLTPEEREAVAGSVRAAIDEEEAKRKALPNSSKAAASAL
ncbi:MAG: mechanosensitive ion channel family protein [Rhizobiaceae bacterium]